MKRSIVSLFTVAVLSSAFTVAATGGAFAHEGAPAHDYEVELGNAPVCDTQKQVERLASALSGDDESAIKIVNAEEHDPTARGKANIAFVRGSRIGAVRTKDHTFDVVEVLVLGIVTANGVQATSPAVYFTLFKIDERVA